MKVCLLLMICPWLFVFGNKDMESTCGHVCPDNWIRFQKSCYIVSYGINRTFLGATNYCRKQDAYLIKISSDIENNFIKSILQKTKAGIAWIGLQDIDTEGSWQSLDGDIQTSFTDWYKDQPSGFTGEDCAAINDIHRQWEDYNCWFMFIPICEREYVTF